jgi:hypothetical protein
LLVASNITADSIGRHGADVDRHGVVSAFVPRVCSALVDVGTDCEDNRKEELELLLCHGLEVHSIVVRLHGEPSASLERPDKRAG